MIVAAEASSSLYAQRLLEHWKKNKIQVNAFGVGNEAMEKLGFNRIGKAEEMAVVGIQEVIANWSIIKKSFNGILEVCKKEKPQFALLMDYPEFNMRLAQKLKALDIPVIYFISPQIWAWREYRVEKIKKYISKMLVLFPFEVDFYKKHGVDVEFVGHPLLDELDHLIPSEAYKIKIKKELGFSENDILLGLMPGSRNSEVKHNFLTLKKASLLLQNKIPNLKTALLVAPTLNTDRFNISKSDNIAIIKREPFEMISLMDYIICASGTATLMVGLAQIPFIVMYQMNWMTALVAKSLVKGVSHFAMVNLIMGKEIVPERFQEKANPEELAKLIYELHTSKSKKSKMIDGLLEMKKKLGSRGAIERIAHALAEYTS